MSWDTTLVKTVRYTIGDIVTPYRFSDYQIEQAILVATKYVQKDVSLVYDYTVVLGSGGYIIPDPTLSSGCSQDAQVLIALRAAALLVDGDVRKMAARTGARAVLGPSNISVDQGPAIKTLLKGGPMAAYNAAKWDYQLVNTVHAYRAILSPARLAYATVEAFSPYFPCPAAPSTPCLSIEDNEDETATVTIGCTVTGSENTFEISGSWMVVDTRTSDGNLIFDSGAGNYNGRVVSRINGASGISDVVPFSVSIPAPTISLTNIGDGSGLSINFSFAAGASGLINYGTASGGPYGTTLVALRTTAFSNTVTVSDTGAFYAQWVLTKNNRQDSGVVPFSITLVSPTLSVTDAGDGQALFVAAETHANTQHTIQYRRYGTPDWTDNHVYFGSINQTRSVPIYGDVEFRLKNMTNGDYNYSNVERETITFDSPTLAISDLQDGDSIQVTVTNSLVSGPNRFQYRVVGVTPWTNGYIASGNNVTQVDGLSTTNYQGRIQSNFGGVIQYTNPVSFTVSLSGFAAPILSATNAGDGVSAYLVAVSGEASATNTVEYKLAAAGTWTTGSSFTGPFTTTVNVGSAGTYNFRVKSDYLAQTVYSNIETVVVELVSSLPDMPNSDINMRAITNPAHPYWDIDLYTEYSEAAGDCPMVLGTRVNYSLNAERTRCSASGDPYEGLATSLELSNGLKHVWIRYGELWSGYKATHPDSFVGSYQASYNLKTDDWMLHTGFNYPTDTDQLAPYLPACTGVGDPIAAPGAVAGIKITEAACLDLANDRFVEMAAGTLRNHFKEDGIWFDEVGYVTGQWDIQVDRFIELKTRFHAEGVRIGMNLGGTNLTAPFAFGPNIFSEIPQMVDFMTHEGPWPRTAGQDGLSTRTQANTERLITNYRSLMDSGVSIVFVPTSATQDNNRHTITSITETDGGTRLLVTFASPAYIFPHGGYAVERMILEGLQAAYSGLEAYGWTPEEVVGNPSQVKLYYRFASLATIKDDLGIVGSISNTGGVLEDYQAATRMGAGLAMMIRRTGDPLFVSQGPSTDESMAGSGNSSSIDCWWYWPQQFGAAVTEPIIDTTGAGGIVTQMHRDFANGTITVYPSGGYVVATLD